MGNAQFSGEPPLADSDLGIWFDGRSFHYQQYRYDRLADAVAYATVDRRRPDYHPMPLPSSWEQWTGPTREEFEVMATSGIVYQQGTYRFEEFRYDFLQQALAYAHRVAAPPPDRTDSPAGVP